MFESTTGMLESFTEVAEVADVAAYVNKKGDKPQLEDFYQGRLVSEAVKEEIRALEEKKQVLAEDKQALAAAKQALAAAKQALAEQRAEDSVLDEPAE